MKDLPAVEFDSSRFVSIAGVCVKEAHVLDKDGNRVLPTTKESQRTGGGKVQMDQKFPG